MCVKNHPIGLPLQAAFYPEQITRILTILLGHALDPTPSAEEGKGKGEGREREIGEEREEEWEFCNH